MKLAIYQGSGQLGNVAQNLEILAKTAAAAAQQGANFLIFPELFLTGYNVGDEIYRLAEPWGGTSLQQVAQVAQNEQIAILVGYVEVEEGNLYNAAALIGAEGQLVGNYRKMHLFGPNEKRWFQPGTQWLIHSIAGMKVGVLICFDVEFPEAVRQLAIRGAELIAIPTANMFPYTLIPTLVVPTRALENQVFIAYVNRTGTEGDLSYCGLSSIVGPDGKALVQAGYDQDLLLAELHSAAIAQERTTYCYLQERRPDLY